MCIIPHQSSLYSRHDVPYPPPLWITIRNNDVSSPFLYASLPSRSSPLPRQWQFEQLLEEISQSLTLEADANEDAAKAPNE